MFPKHRSCSSCVPNRFRSDTDRQHNRRCGACHLKLTNALMRTVSPNVAIIVDSVATRHNVNAWGNTPSSRRIPIRIQSLRFVPTRLSRNWTVLIDLLWSKSICLPVRSLSRRCLSGLPINDPTQPRAWPWAITSRHFVQNTTTLRSLKTVLQMKSKLTCAIFSQATVVRSSVASGSKTCALPKLRSNDWHQSGLLCSR